MDLVDHWLSGPMGVVAWLTIVVIIVGTGLLMRHLALTTRPVAYRHVVLMVATSVGLLVIAGVGGFMLMHLA
jgi:hypothetical protein